MYPDVVHLMIVAAVVLLTNHAPLASYLVAVGTFRHCLGLTGAVAKKWDFFIFLSLKTKTIPKNVPCVVFLTKQYPPPNEAGPFKGSPFQDGSQEDEYDENK